MSLPIRILPFPVLRLDAGGTIVESNHILERELGLAPDALAGRALADVVHDDARAAASALMQAGRAGPATQALRFAGADDARLSLVLRAVPDGDALWIVAMPERREMSRLRDELSTAASELTSRERELARSNRELATALRQLTDATEAKSRFLATMSHELRTPLNAVMGYSGLLRDGVYGSLPETQAHAVGAIWRRARDLKLLIDDVLDLSKIEAGRMDVRVEPVEVGRVLDEVRETIAPLAAEKGLALVARSETGGEPPLEVLIDRTKYKQILLNLASNAVKFTPRRGTVEVTIAPAENDCFVTRVRDTGIGIARENLGRIFESFQQLEDGTTRRYPGTGLGLSIARRLTELMGGTIAVESDVGLGTTFVVSLPRRAEEPLPLPPEIPAQGEMPAADAPIVLAIDDEPDVIALMRDSLAPAGYRVVGALSGARGLELARALRPYAITLDIMMPEKDGWQVLREIKADPALRDVPVIVMSIVAERTLGFSLGVTEYLVKPVDRAVLLDVLERLRRQGPPTALIVDDDLDARMLLRDLLASLGFEVRTAGEASEASALLRERPPTLLFLSLTLPEDEISAVLEAVSGDRRLDDTHTIFVTQSETPAEITKRVQRAASSAVLQSSSRPDELLRQLRALLAGKASGGSSASPADRSRPPADPHVQESSAASSCVVRGARDRRAAIHDRRTDMRRWMVAGVVSLALWAAGAACNRGSEAARDEASARGAAGSAPAYAPAPEEKALGVAADARQAARSAPTAPGAPLPAADTATVAPTMLIRTGNASIEVDSLEPAVAQVRQLAQRVGGFIANTSMQTGRDQLRSATLEIKLPAQRWEETVRGLQPIGRVESVTESTQDVGEEYVDVSARVANARRLEQRLVELLGRRTGKLEDVLAVERELARVREEIERYEGRLRYLRTRAAVSTLAVTVHEPPPIVGRTSGHSPITEAFRTAWRNFVGFIALFIGALGWIIPLGLVLAAAAWILKRLRRWPHRPEPPGDGTTKG